MAFIRVLNERSKRVWESIVTPKNFEGFSFLAIYTICLAIKITHNEQVTTALGIAYKNSVMLFIP